MKRTDHCFPISWLAGFFKDLTLKLQWRVEFSDHEQQRKIKQNIGSCKSEQEKEGKGICEDKGIGIQHLLVFQVWKPCLVN